MGQQTALNYRSLDRDARLIVRSLAELEIDEISSDAATAILAGDTECAQNAVAQLAHDGWIVGPTGATWSLSRVAQEWIGAHRSSLTTTAVKKAIAELAEHHRVALDQSSSFERAIRHAVEHRDEITATAQVIARLGDYASATRLTDMAWRLAAEIDDPDWWRQLAHIGEGAAIHDRNPSVLIDLLSRSAEVFLGAGDHATAEKQWIRARAVAKQLNEPDRIQATLRQLGGLYRATGRLHKALDVYLALAEACYETGDVSATVEARKDLAATMLEARRPESAMVLLTEIDTVIADLNDRSPEVVGIHIDTLVMLGQVMQSRESNAAAVDYFRRALMLVADHDAPASSRIRELLVAASASD